MLLISNQLHYFIFIDLFMYVILIFSFGVIVFTNCNCISVYLYLYFCCLFEKKIEIKRNIKKNKKSIGHTVCFSSYLPYGRLPHLARNLKLTNWCNFYTWCHTCGISKQVLVICSRNLLLHRFIATIRTFRVLMKDSEVYI